MSLLTICQSVADAVPVERPAAIAGSTNKTAKLLLVCAQQAGKSLAKHPHKSGGWAALQTEHTFNTVVSQADYDLPSDFDRVINETVWDRNNYWKMRGGLDPQQWQRVKSSVLAESVTTRKRFRIRNVSGTVKFSIDPTPTAIESCVFEYISNNWCETSGGAGQSQWAADTDVGVLDEYLLELGTLWRFLKRLGMDYSAELAEYNNEVSQAVARDGGAQTLNVAGSAGFKLIDFSNVPDSGYGS